MKFRFCGGGDCPDWVLAEIHSTLSKINSVKLGLLSQIVAENVRSDDIPEDKIKDLTDSKLDATFAKSALSCLRYLLTSAARNNTPEAIFCEELQQLGLPKEHSHILSRVLVEKLQHMQKYLVQDSLYVNHLKDFKCNWNKSESDCAQLLIKIENEIVDGQENNTTYQIKINETDLSVLLNELKVINDLMKSYNYEQKYAEL